MSSDRSTFRSTGMTLLRLLPLLLPFTVLFFGGLTLAVAQSLGFLLPVPIDGEMFAAYSQLLKPHLLISAGYSLWVAGASSTLAVAIGAVMAPMIWRLPHNLSRASGIYKIPLILPHISAAFIVLIWWSQSGIIASLASHIGLINTPNQFPALLHNGSGAGMILAYVFKEVPFVIILALAVLRRLNPQLIDTAKMLGASPRTIFWRITLPHMNPALTTAFIILFLYGFGAFDIPFLLGESCPGMLSIEIFNLYFRKELTDRPVAMAILVCMFLFSLFFIVVYTKIAARLRRMDRKL